MGKWLNWVTILAYALGAFTGAWLTRLLGGLKSKVA